jgi:hypothetical protein
MPLFITYASYSHSGVKGLVNKPEDRSGGVKALIEKAGGTLVALYNTNWPKRRCAHFRTRLWIGCGHHGNGCCSIWRVIQSRNTPGEFKGIAEKAARVASAYTPRKIIA